MKDTRVKSDQKQNRATMLMTEGKIWKQLLVFAVPLILGNLLQQMYNAVDSIIVGNYVGSNALAAVGSSNALINLLIAFAQGASVGAGVVISQFLGAGDTKRVHRAVHTAATIALLLGVMLTGAGIALSRVLLVAMDTPTAVLNDSVLYLRIYAGGFLFNVVYNMATGILNAAGNSRRPLLYLGAASVTNIVLDLVLIEGCKMGVAGAAVATVIAQGVSVVLCILYVMARVRILIPGRKHLDVGRKLYWDLFSQSISMGLMSSIVSAGSVILQYGINGLGTLTIAGHTAARKLFAFTDMPLIAMANAASTFVSQNYGAGQPERIRKGMREIYLYSLVVMVVTVLLMQVSAEWLVRMVSGSSEALVLENGARYLRWTSPFYAVLGVLLSTRYALQSLGEKVLPLFSSVIEFLGKVVFVLVFIPHFAYNAVILCEPVIWCFMALYLVAVYRCNPFVFPKKQ